MKKEKIDCDCFLGFVSGEKAYKSNIDDELDKIVRLQPIFKMYGILNGEPLNKSQIVDGRKGYLDRFIYCPYCSEKINWVKIIHELTIVK